MHEVFDQFKQQLPDIDPAETQEWMESLDARRRAGGPDRARYIIYKLLKRARQLNVGLPPLVQTRYINTISPEQEPYFPGDEAMELRDPAHDPLERAGDGAARQHALRGHRRAPVDLRQRRQPVRGRLQPLLPRAR